MIDVLCGLRWGTDKGGHVRRETLSIIKPTTTAHRGFSSPSTDLSGTPSRREFTRAS